MLDLNRFTQDPLDVNLFLAYCEKRDKDSFDYFDNQNCAFAQYLKSIVVDPTDIVYVAGRSFSIGRSSSQIDDLLLLTSKLERSSYGKDNNVEVSDEFTGSMMNGVVADSLSVTTVTDAGPTFRGIAKQIRYRMRYN